MTNSNQGNSRIIWSPVNHRYKNPESMIAAGFDSKGCLLRSGGDAFVNQQLFTGCSNERLRMLGTILDWKAFFEEKGWFCIDEKHNLDSFSLS